jgi:ubiquinone/menaquinone biosynthesis C-methylase UbiE
MSRIQEQAKELRKIWSGFQASRVLLTANNLRVFDYLKKQKTHRELAKNLGTDIRATGILLDALTGLVLLKKQKGRYSNTKIASELLVSGSPFYQGDILRHADTLWDTWSGLDKVIKTGKPSFSSKNHSAFILGMHNLSVLKAREIISIIGLKGVHRALDLGGGPGTYAMVMAGKGVHAVLFDTPDTIRIARQLVKKTDKKNLDFIQGDFFTDNIGTHYDLILISQIFHSYSAHDNMDILKKCRKALNDNGRVVIQEFLLKESRTLPSWSSLFSVNMVVNNTGGRCYSPDEMRSWLKKSGFRKVNKKLVADGVLMSAVK